MAKRLEIKFKDGHNEIHFDGVNGDSYTLCGFDEAGDNGWDTATETSKKVSCGSCIRIVEYCQKHIKKSEYLHY